MVATPGVDRGRRKGGHGHGLRGAAGAGCDTAEVHRARGRRQGAGHLARNGEQVGRQVDRGVVVGTRPGDPEDVAVRAADDRVQGGAVTQVAARSGRSDRRVPAQEAGGVGAGQGQLEVTDVGCDRSAADVGRALVAGQSTVGVGGEAEAPVRGGHLVGRLGAETTGQDQPDAAEDHLVAELRGTVDEGTLQVVQDRDPAGLRTLAARGRQTVGLGVEVEELRGEVGREHRRLGRVEAGVRGDDAVRHPSGPGTVRHGYLCCPGTTAGSRSPGPCPWRPPVAWSPRSWGSAAAPPGPHPASGRPGSGGSTDVAMIATASPPCVVAGWCCVLACLPQLDPSDDGCARTVRQGSACGFLVLGSIRRVGGGRSALGSGGSDG